MNRLAAVVNATGGDSVADVLARLSQVDESGPVVLAVAGSTQPHGMALYKVDRQGEASA